MTLGLFVPRESPIHALPAHIKLIGMAIAGISVFFISNIVILVAMMGVVMILVSLARLPRRLVWAQLRALVWVFAGILILHALLTHWLVGVVLVLRFAMLLLLATLVTLTTKLSDMVDAIERGLTPLKRFGVRPAQISLMISMAIRLIPMLLEQIRDVQEAQRARGVDTPMITLLVPVLIRVLRLADCLADALDARCYDADEE
ncbi:MAG: energy-coupling factor transporter transmembrane component T family protein [Elainellaceae cyanobacterium]